jgi:HEAT repeat protein
MTHTLRYLLQIALLLCLGVPVALAADAKALVVPELPQGGIPQEISPSVREQILKLYTPDPQAQAQALLALDKLGKQALPAIPYMLYLCPATQTVSSDNQTREPLGIVTKRVLANLAVADPQAFLPAIQDPDSPRTCFALEALAGCEEPAVKARILTLASARLPQTRQGAAVALVPLFGQKGHEDASEKLRETLAQDSAVEVRLGIVDELTRRAQKPDSPLAPLILVALRNANEAVRCRAMSQCFGHAAATIFEEVFTSYDRQVGPGEAKARDEFLSKCASISIGTVSELLKSEIPMVREQAMFASYQYPETDGPLRVDRWFRGERDDEIRLRVLTRILERWHGAVEEAQQRRQRQLRPSEHPKLEQREEEVVMVAYYDDDPRVATMAVRALAGCRQRERIVPYLESAIKRRGVGVAALEGLEPGELREQQLLVALESDEAELRALGIERVGLHGLNGSRVIKALLHVGSRHHDVAEDAYAGALRCGPSGIQNVLEILHSTPSPVMRAAIYGAAYRVLPVEQARELLGAAQQDEDNDVKRRAADLLAALNSGKRVSSTQPEATAGPVGGEPSYPEDAAAFVNQLWQDQHRIHQHQPGVTEWPLDGAVCERLLSVLKHEDGESAERAAVLLARARYAPGLLPVMDYLAYHHPRRLDAKDIAFFGPAIAGPFAALIIHDPRPEVRTEVFSGLFKALENSALRQEFLADPQYGKAYILIMLQAPDVQNRLRTVSCAATYLPESLRLPGLEAAKRDPDPKVGRNATDQLARLASAGRESRILEPSSGPLTEEEIAVRAQSPQWGMRAQAAKLAGSTWTPRTRALLLELLHDRDERVWQAAGKTLLLQAKQDEVIRQELASMLAGDDPEHQLAALRFLQSGRDPDSDPLWSHVAALFRSSDHRVRLAIVRAIQQQNKTSIYSGQLTRLLQDENRAVANEALHCLRGMR